MAKRKKPASGPRASEQEAAGDFIERTEGKHPDIAQFLGDSENLPATSRALYEKRLEPLKGTGGRGHAEAYLSLMLQLGDSYLDAEALVYLRCRGVNCEERVGDFISLVREAEERSKKRTEGGTSGDRASVYTDYEKPGIPRFWSGFHEEEAAIDATMFRATEWCGIGGMDPWMENVSRNLRVHILQGEYAPIPFSGLMFNFCRSDLALRWLGQTLVRGLEVFTCDELPWVGQRWRNEIHGATSIPCVASLVFAAHRLPDDQSTSLIKAAQDELVRSQAKDGSWNALSSIERPSIEATAKAVHALCMAKPLGYQRAVAIASQWLLGQQHADGFWEEPASPGAVYLTVLVLDAIEFAGEARHLTCFHSQRDEDDDYGGLTERMFRIVESLEAAIPNRLTQQQLADTHLCSRSTIEKDLRVLREWTKPGPLASPGDGSGYTSTEYASAFLARHQR